MTKLVYGVDTTKEVTPKDVRDATIKCFIKAHKEVLDDMGEDGVDPKEIEKIKKMSIELQIKKTFEDVGADFDNPTKEDLLKACEKLAKFAENFRKPEIVNKHYSEIAGLIKKIK
ncbi:MAG: hypothetical protein L3J07_04490 [Candidatus Magasanikbacteria bacterium]|nr:hypothetical protein [Candidatus Magasanikbacteria bacterium]